MEECFTAPFTILRLLTPLKMTYAAAEERAEPYTSIVEELLDMSRTRRDPNTLLLLCGMPFGKPRTGPRPRLLLRSVSAHGEKESPSLGTESQAARARGALYGPASPDAAQDAL